MAVYHFSARVIGRSQGRSVVAAAAYRAAARLHDEHLGRGFDYTAKAGVVHSEILLPEGAPVAWAAARWGAKTMTSKARTEIHLISCSLNRWWCGGRTGSAARWRGYRVPTCGSASAWG